MRPSPLVGFNNNVRHQGRVFHIQTEDSGVDRPHVLTHLFADGGRILKSFKTSYAEHVQSPDLTQIVRTLMQQQHKKMFTSLRDGVFDSAIAQLDLPQAPARPPQADAQSPSGPASMARPQAPPLSLRSQTFEQAASPLQKGFSQRLEASATPAPPRTATPMPFPSPATAARTPETGRYATPRGAEAAVSPKTGDVPKGELDDLVLAFLDDGAGVKPGSK